MTFKTTSPRPSTGERRKLNQKMNPTNLMQFKKDVICPIATEVVKYKEGLIPLRVLEIASYVKETGFIDVLEVWHPANGDYKDSVLVGVKHIKRQYGTDEERYILARWGVELASFTELIKVAREKLFSSLKSKLSTAQINIENDLTKLEFFVNRYILGEGELPSCTYYGM